jgi:hypothetical protein
MMYVYERMMDQVVQDRHAALAEIYSRSQRPGVVASGLGSMLIRAGTWLRKDVEMPVMLVSAQPKLRPADC